MESNFLAFCYRQSTKMIEYAADCTDPVLKGEFLKMSAYWLKLVPTTDTKDSAVKSSKAFPSSKEATIQRPLESSRERLTPI
jgi:hypothetical protein